MPIGIASVGDIIAVCLLVKDLINALNESRGSPHDFQQLVQQLQSLADVLHEVEGLVKRHGASPGLDALRVSISRNAASCRGSIDPFLAKVRKYQRSLRVGGSGSILQDAARKMCWKICDAHEVDKFRTEIIAHTASMQALLEVWNITTNECAHTATQQAIKAAATSAQYTSTAQTGLLRMILSRVDESINVAGRSWLLLSSVFTMSRMSWLRDFGLELMTRMSTIQGCLFQTYHTVLSINTKLSWLTSELLLSRGTFVLTDGLGRTLPMHIEFVNSWDVFDAAVEARFRGLKGYKKVLNKEFALQDKRTGLEISRRRPWEGVVQPQQRIDMEMIFASTCTVEPRRRACPTCSQAASEDAEANHVDCNTETP